MKLQRLTIMTGLAIALAAIGVTELQSQTTKAAPAFAPTRMTVTANVDEGKRAPVIEKDDITVKSGKERLPVTEWVPARDADAGLELFFLIDDASLSGLALEFEEMRSFIEAQPSSSYIGVAYARNAAAEIRQTLTTDHALASKALRMPLQNVGAYGSPYLSVIDLMKRWPGTLNRREIILITDGVDRAGRGRNALLNPDVDRAADAAQRTGTIIHTIYYPGAGHWNRNFWVASLGQNAIAKLSDITGGESFFLGRQAPVSFKPYLEQLQRILDNQYLLSFSVVPAKKAGFTNVSIRTEVAGVDLNAAGAVWTPGVR
jgi:hypothetical protein